jgi:hypothetical protein
MIPGVVLHGRIQKPGYSVSSCVYLALVVRMNSEPRNLNMAWLQNLAKGFDMLPCAIADQDTLAVRISCNDRVALQRRRFVPNPLLDPARYVAVIFRSPALEALGKATVILP